MPAPSNLVHETASTTGTGNFTLTAVNGKRTFNTAFGNGAPLDVFSYFISNRDAAEWEIGTGHMSAATTLVRDTVTSSSNANALVNFSAGTKDVANDIPAEEQVRSAQVILQSLLTTRGDIIRRSATVAERLALGTNGHVYQSNGTDVVTGQLVAGAFNTSVPVITTAMIAAMDTDGTLAANSDTAIPSQKAVKTYAQPKDADLTAFAAITGMAHHLIWELYAR